MKKIIAIVFMSTFCISGCELVGPSVKVQSPKVKVHSEDEQKFCPPGQAKKGNC